MDDRVKTVVRHVTEASDHDMPFPEVVKALLEVGVERYHADLVAANKTYYMPDDSFETVRCSRVAAPAATFAAGEVEAAVRCIQGKQIGYPEFCRRIAAAGCVGYFASLVGRRAVYYGRTNDSYTEPFPGAH